MVLGANEGGVIEDDAGLLRATRAGDAASYGHLYERHAGAALVVARQYTDSAADAEDVVADAFANVHRAILGGGGPEAAFRAYLFTVVRRVAAVHRSAGRRVEPTDDVATLETASAPVETAEAPTLAGFERSVVARAFRSLPERWREVLWHSEVEGLTPAQIAPIVGLTANSTAALAYRAREGLRQAYLQQHLQDPLDDGCRAVAGKLGAHVRGGLGARDTRQVEEHLDGCGDCRTLVLELGDVNHGMRAVVAPLVLGLLGLGALRHPLPVGGGLAAGTAALAQPAGAAGASGSGGAGAASGGGASGGASGAGGAAVAGTGTAAGGVAAVGATGVLAGASASAVAAVAAVAAVVVVVVVGVVQLLSGPDGAEAEPTPDVSGASQTASASPSADVARGPSSSPTGVPTTSPAPSPDPSDDATTRSTRHRAAARATPPARPLPAGGPTGGATGAPTAAAPAPTGPGPTDPPAASPSPDPDPLPADVVVAAPAGGITLTAGAGGQPIELTVSNAGGLPAAGLVADVDLPVGVTLESGGNVTIGFGFAPGDPVTWLCVTGAEGRTATCTLDELPPGQDALLALTVGVDESYHASGDEAVRVRIAGTGRTWEPAPIRVTVASSPARLAFGDGVPSDVQLVTGRSRTFELPVRNAGGRAVTPGAPAVVELDLPAGVTGTAALPWVCAPADGPRLTCRHDALAAFEHSTLSVVLSGAPGAATGSGAVHVRLTPSAYRPVETRDVAYTLVRPATLGVEAPTALDVAPGTPAVLPLVVANGGDLAAPGATLTLDAPEGAVVEDVTGAGWTCTPAAGDAVCTADLPAGARSAVAARLSAPVGTAGALGAVTVTVGGADADVPAGPVPVAVRAVEPLLAVTDATAVVDAVRGGTIAFVARVAPHRPDGRPAAAAADVRATLTLPPGISADPSSLGPQTSGCTSAGAEVTCALGELAAGAVVPVQVDVRAAGAVRGTVGLRLTATGAQPATASTQVVVSSANLTPVWSGTGDLDVVEVGAPLLGCVGPYAPTCPVAIGDRDNNSFTMRPLDLDPPGGPRASVPVSSSTHLDVPDARPVVWAGLYWSAVRGPSDQWSAPRDTARLRAPDGTWTDVTAGSVTYVTDNARREYYQAAVDVTELVAAGGAGAWALADAAVSATRSDREPSYYGGWSLVVVHGTQTEPGAAGASAVTVHQGGAWIGTSSTAPAFAFVAEAGALTRIGVVAWDGDRSTAGDRLLLSGVGALTPQRWDGSGPGGGGSSANAFDSTATGWRHANSLGVDAKGFAEVALPSGVGTLTPTTATDQYLIGVVTVRTTAPPLLGSSRG
ncbi:sigma-70 family RNA polymerase sigma factor [Cellulomonas wangsupingiae]|uniref:Sigma-70 family RNA polymerase sigma factor n=3 Tax=Cellulomonas wangsupingiae TaxID=2968085 RepID=A0ABY5K984_9CELL|nr:sigma-70 family RNA polymerase sigma factor [Cellulomonas wangsupingiae]UUI65635.1 sigma-70 family RNA polymerase sigma factor [Cellulomonas wangsupingiae]